jgi:hypothetical protein
MVKVHVTKSTAFVTKARVKSALGLGRVKTLRLDLSTGGGSRVLSAAGSGHQERSLGLAAYV